MNNKKILLLTKDYSNFKRGQNYLSLIPTDPNKKKKWNIHELDFLTPSNRKTYDRYNFCNTLFKKIFKKLTKILNKLHETNFSDREWDVIIGPWLKNYIYLCYKIQKQLEFIFKENKINKVFASNFKNFDFITKDTHHFTDTISTNLNWYYCFCSKVADYFRFNSKEIVFRKLYPETKTIENIIYNKNLKIIKNIFRTFSNNLRSSNAAFISNTYLPFIEEKKLELLFFQVPSVYETPYIESNPTDLKVRKNYFDFSEEKKISLENFILTNLSYFIPKSFVENYKKITMHVKTKNFPKNPKFIFTSSLYLHDEVFKVYAAHQIKKNKPYYIGQHGNNYFTRIHHNYLPELKNSDKFFSWGYKNKNKNIEGLFNFKTLNKKVENTNYNKKKLLIVLDTIANIPDNLFFYPDEIKKNLIKIKFFLDSLNKEIRDNVILRLNRDFFKKIYGIKYINFVKSFNVRIDDGETKITELLDDSKLCIFNYDSSGFLENYCKGIPSIMLFNKSYINFITKEFQKKYKDLIKNKIIFNNEVLLAEHINKFWFNMENWWDLKETKKVLKNFNSNLNVIGEKQSLDILKSKLVDL